MILCGNLLTQYLYGVLSLELDLFVQKKTIAELTSRYNSLAIKRNINVPQREKPETPIFACMFFAGIAAGIVVGICTLIDGWSSAKNFFYYIAAVIAALLYAAGGALAGAIVLGIPVWAFLYIKEKRKLDRDLQRRLSWYENEVKKQKARLKQEQLQKDALGKEIASLRACLSKTTEYLQKAYSYKVLDPEYRNIYAVSSFYGYLKKGRTCCLQFDGQTGDQGAYNIYENERRMDLIITNTEEILYRLDQVIHNQRELAVGLENATRQVKSLCGDVNRQLTRIANTTESIERCQNVIAYNAECSRRNLEFLTWIHTVY